MSNKRIKKKIEKRKGCHTYDGWARVLVRELELEVELEREKRHNIWQSEQLKMREQK